MIKRAVVLAPARGYVDGRFIGEEKESTDALGDRRKRGKGRRGKGDSVLADNIGNTTRKKKQSKGKARGPNARGAAGGSAQGAQGAQGARGTGKGRGKRKAANPLVGVIMEPGAQGRHGGRGGHGDHGNVNGNSAGNAGGNLSTPGGRRRKSSKGKNTPFRTAQNSNMSPTQSADMRRLGDEAKSGQFAEALAAGANIKRERLHKVMAQSGHGSRRDMEIMIASGRVMVNGIVATAGTQVAPGDRVLVDLRPVKLKFSEDLPRVLLYHKPEGEIVTTDDPGNRITVFDNLPRVEMGKWVAVGRLDINTSGLLIFTTGGELANRFMHPRYEVEREYAVRILGELTEQQTQNLLSGVDIGGDDGDDRHRRANFDEDGAADDDAFDALPEDDGDEADAAFNRAPDAKPDAPAAQPGEEDEYEDDDRQPDFDALPQVAAGGVLESAAASASPVRAGPGNRLAKFDSIEKRGGEGANQWYHVVIREGRNREVRKMFESQGLTVSRLIRTRFGAVELPPRLTRGKMVELTPEQVRTVLASVGIQVDGPKASLTSTRPQKSSGKRDAETRTAEPRGAREGTSRREGRPGRGRRNNERQPQVASNNAQVMTEGEDFVAGAAALEGLPADAGIAAPMPREPGDRNNQNRRRARRGRTGRGRRPDPIAAGDGNVPRQQENTGARRQAGAGGRGDRTGSETASVVPAAGGESNDNRNRGKSRRTFRGRRRNGRGSGGNGGTSDAGNQAAPKSDKSFDDDFGNR
jgi:16S rRNA U516 pseudouridylate synthase RsuA-like enzyme